MIMILDDVDRHSDDAVSSLNARDKHNKLQFINRRYALTKKSHWKVTFGLSWDPLDCNFGLIITLSPTPRLAMRSPPDHPPHLFLYLACPVYKLAQHQLIHHLFLRSCLMNFNAISYKENAVSIGSKFIFAIISGEWLWVEVRCGIEESKQKHG